MRENAFKNSIQSYQMAQSELNRLNSDSDLSLDVRNALELLKKDIHFRIRELELLKEASANDSIVSLSNISLPRVADASAFPNGNSTVLTDPLLISITNKLENNLLHFINPDKTDKIAISEISQQVNQLRRELCLYEQRKFKEYDLKLEQVMKENKKLSNQVVRLKERWDGLVESAKLKRNQQQP